MHVLEYGNQPRINNHWIYLVGCISYLGRYQLEKDLRVIGPVDGTCVTR